MNRRTAARYPLHAEVLLVTAGDDGPVVRPGRSREVSAGGCTLRLDAPLDASVPGGVLVVRTGATDLRMLSGPVRPESGDPHVIGLRFVPPTENDDGWSELVESLAAGE